MARDENGQWLPQHDWAGFMGTDEHYRSRILAAGSHGFEYVTKYFAPRQPVKRLTLWLCVRGVDGRLMGRNVVGIALVDDLRLSEAGATADDLAARGVAVVKPPPAVQFKQAGGDFQDGPVLDPGERLWGTNSMAYAVAGSPDGYARTIKFTLQDPDGKTVAERDLGEVGGGHQAGGKMPYRLTRLCADWREQYAFAGWTSFPFGTPPAPISLRLTTSYAYPDENVEAGVNLHVTRETLAEEVAACRVLVKHPAGEKIVLDAPDVAKALWTADAERPVMLNDGHVDARNLLALSIDAGGLPVHPAHDPVRDCVVVVTLKDKAGRVIAERSSEPFGFMNRPAPPALPDRIEKTELSPAGLMLVNGKPFFFRPFPTGKADLGAVSRMHHFPKTHKILPLPFPPELVFKPEEDAAWKAKVQEFVRANKDDPRLFGWYFQHNGETTFWFDQWKQMAECQRKVAAWAREVDANHLVLSAEWLFGHAALKPETAEPFAFLDVIDVEPGLRWTPDSHAVRKAVGRPVAVVAGLETYYSQPPGLIRWRMYEALRQGASDVGICPSAMLYPKPETVSFLRGLYGEMLGLEPVLAAAVPAAPSACSDAGVTLWERQDGRTRYVVAMRGGPRKTDGGEEGEKGEEAAQGAPAAPVTFTLPGAATRVQVMFEGREVKPEGERFTDELSDPYTVRVYRVTQASN